MRRQFTGFFMLTAALTAVAATLVAIELFLAGLFYAAAGALLFGMVAGVHTYKQQVTIGIVHGVRRNVAKLGAATQQAPSVMAPATPPTPARSAEPQQPINKLRQITPWTPPKTSYSQKQGRIAAGVTPDPDAPYRLFAATSGMGAPDIDNVSARPIAFVGSDALAALLSEHHTVQRLHPRLTAAELEHSLPSALVVEEGAIDDGPWSGALDPDGSALLTELRAAQAWIRRTAGINYVLPATGSTHVAASALRVDTVLVRAGRPQGNEGPSALFDAMQQHLEPGVTA